jgi:hypothetical protein
MNKQVIMSRQMESFIPLHVHWRSLHIQHTNHSWSHYVYPMNWFITQEVGGRDARLTASALGCWISSHSIYWSRVWEGVRCHYQSQCKAARAVVRSISLHLDIIYPQHELTHREADWQTYHTNLSRHSWWRDVGGGGLSLGLELWIKQPSETK